MKVIDFLPRRWWTLKAWKTWASYIHWRLETYGVFYPQGRFNRAAFRLLLKQLPSYQRWLADIERARLQNLHSRNS